MNKIWPIILNKTIFLWIILFFLAVTGCQYNVTGSSEKKPSSFHIEKIVLMGFKDAMAQGKATEAIRNPVSGRVSKAEPATDGASEYMTSRLFDMMLKHKKFVLISPENAAEASSKIVSSNRGINSDVEALSRIAQYFASDAVITGYLYRWKEREGTDYAVDHPASVAFDLCLVNAKDGSILWRGRFDKTQKSLIENILDISTFIKGKGKWMTAENLAQLGLEDLLNDLFLFMEKGETAKN